MFLFYMEPMCTFNIFEGIYNRDEMLSDPKERWSMDAVHLLNLALNIYVSLLHADKFGTFGPPTFKLISFSSASTLDKHQSMRAQHMPSINFQWPMTSIDDLFEKYARWPRTRLLFADKFLFSAIYAIWSLPTLSGGVRIEMIV